MSNKPGDKFGRLTLLSQAVSGIGNRTRWLCRCECGMEKIIRQSTLRNGATRSCGCLSAEMTRRRSVIHGHSQRTPEYNVWSSMIQRCENENSEYYEYYGGRGIAVCSSWHTFVNFLSYLKATIGLRPSSDHSIDRINNDGNYEPGNVRWSTIQEQNINRRSWIKNKKVLVGV